jgi:SPW repeat
MKTWNRWQDWSNAILGAYAMCVPLFTIDSSDSYTVWSAEIFGLLIIGVAVWALAQPQSKAAPWTQAVVGVLFALAPLLFGYNDLSGAAGNAYVVGSLVALLALWTVPEASRASSEHNPSYGHRS